MFDLVNWVDQVKIPKMKVRQKAELVLHAFKLRDAPRFILKPKLNHTNQNHGENTNKNNNQNIPVSLNHL